MSFTANRADPVCGTCRRKSRKCDRTRPQCQRCLSKGLVCEGYETKFKIYNINSGLKKASNVRSRARERQSRNSQSHVTQFEQALSTQDSPAQISSESKQSSPNETNESNTSPATDTLSPDFSVSVHSHQGLQGLDDLLAKPENQTLLSFFETTSSNIFMISSSTQSNPFQDHILPLAHRYTSLLHAVLGLSACHIPTDQILHPHTTALEHKLSAIQALGSLLVKEEYLGLSSVEEDMALSMVLLLLLQDICESGVSSNGTHLNGVVFLCTRIATSNEAQSPFRTFLLAALTWFDLIRGMSGPEKLAFPLAVRDYVSNTIDFSLQSFTGCPRIIFKLIEDVLSTGKTWLAGNISTEIFQLILDQSSERLRNWDMHQEDYPDPDPGWPLLADAYRHTALLRNLRFPDTFSVPCTDTLIKVSVDRILDISALMLPSSPCYKRLVFPLFMAGADTESAHQQRYIRICMEQIRDATCIAQPALLQLLGNVWQARENSPHDKNVPWMEWTCSSYLKRQHDFLFF